MRRYLKFTLSQLQKLKNIILDSKKSKEVKKAQVIILLNKEKGIKEITTMTGYERSWMA